MFAQKEKYHCRLQITNIQVIKGTLFRLYQDPLETQNIIYLVNTELV